MTKRNPTIPDVAQVAGVSTATVSRALNGGTISAQTRRKVEAAINSLGYRRNTLARGLVTGKSGIIGVLIPDVVGPLYMQMARGIEDVLEPRGMHFMMVTDNRNLTQEHNAIELLLERRVDALILIGSRLETDTLLTLTGPMTSLTTPVVLVQRECLSNPSPLPTVQLDNHYGVGAALDHLVLQGHRHIAHIAGIRRDGHERREAYCHLMRERGLNPDWLIESDSTETSGSEALGTLLTFMAEGVTAVFCSNDRIALGLYHALKLYRTRIPDDLSIIGFDDLPWVSYLDPPLTTVRQPGREMGRMSAMKVLAALELSPTASSAKQLTTRQYAATEPHAVRPKLIIRESVRRLGGD